MPFPFSFLYLLCELENAPEIQKYFKTFVHDCSLPSSLLVGSVFVSRISESERGQSGELNCFARGIYFELSFCGL